MSNRKGQITLFVIVAVMLVAAVVLVYYFSRNISAVPAKLSPAESEIKACIQDSLNSGISILGEQGGFIKAPDFEAGSTLFPTTSQINFFGSLMPYWFYISGNGLPRTQVPTIASMERQLDDYISTSVQSCDFSDLTDRGYEIEFASNPEVATTINQDTVSASVQWPASITLGQTTARIEKHDVSIKSDLSDMYDTARRIFEKENSEMFLEQQTLDIISLYAPTTDVALSCAPQIWSKGKVVGDLKNALAANLGALKFSGSYYTLAAKENRYFVKDIGKTITNGQVGIIYDPNFPTYVEVYPSDGDIMKADAIGTQEGLGVIGFCYVPYHFVYSMNFPVIVQIYDPNMKLFQFPLVVYVKDNGMRNSTQAEQPPTFENTVCQYKNTDFEVSTVDKFGDKIDKVKITLKCGGASCSMGSTDHGSLNASFPQCVNGFIVAQKEGYAMASVQASTDTEGSAEIIMKKIYNLSLRAFVNNFAVSGNQSAVIMFSSPDYSTNLYYPTQQQISLPEGDYKVTTYLFKNGKITLPAQSSQKCVDVPQAGFMGMFGFTSEKCFDVQMPAQELSQVTVGGGTAQRTFTEEELKSSTLMELSIPTQATPTTLNDLQTVYSVIDTSELGIELK